MATTARAAPHRLQYFNIEGPAEKARLAMRIAKIPFTDDRVSFEQWPSIKPTTPYGQLPVLHLADGTELAQSDAILRYIGRCARDEGAAPHLYPKGGETAVDEAIALVDDMLTSWRSCLYIGMNPSALGHECDDGSEFKGSAKHDEITKRMRETWMRDEFPKYCGFFAKRFENGQQWLCPGDAPTLADCALVPALRRFSSGGIDYVDAACLDAYPEIKAYYERFHAIPEVKEWYAERAAAASS